MYNLKSAKNYEPRLSLRDTERAVKLLKDTFERELADRLNLERISAPILVAADSGINDDLNGIERPVRFDLKQIPDYNAEIVQSLAKWKRVALYNYGFAAGEGLYTDMNAIRRDDTVDNIHSVYVDQWDWELIITREQRTLDFLKSIVVKIVDAIVSVQELVKNEFSAITSSLCRDVCFITSEQLLQKYPTLSAKERENRITKEKKTVFLMQIGGKLSSGERHDGRAPDYDDWQLNGDLLFYNEVLDEALEISSMGIRVDGDSLESQLIAADKTDRRGFDYHKSILSGTLPLTIGGGIGQSRLCLLLLQKLHIGEVQASIWPRQMLEECKRMGIQLL